MTLLSTDFGPPWLFYFSVISDKVAINVSGLNQKKKGFAVLLHIVPQMKEEEEILILMRKKVHVI